MKLTVYMIMLKVLDARLGFIIKFSYVLSFKRLKTLVYTCVCQFVSCICLLNFIKLGHEGHRIDASHPSKALKHKLHLGLAVATHVALLP